MNIFLQKKLTLETKNDASYENIDLDTTFKLFCGTDVSNINTPIDISVLTKESDTKYSFTYDDSIMPGAFEDKTTYIKVVVADKLGNEKTFIQTVPKKTEIKYLTKTPNANNYFKNPDVNKDYGSGGYGYYFINYVIDSTYGINPVIMQVNDGKKIDIEYLSNKLKAYFRESYTYNLEGSTSSGFWCKDENSYQRDIGSYFSSEFGQICAQIKRTDKIKWGRENPDYFDFDINEDVVLENNQPVQFEITKKKEFENYTIYSIKVNGKIKFEVDPTFDFIYKIKKFDADYLLQIDDYGFYFEGNEADFIVPSTVADGYLDKSENVKLFGVTNTHISDNTSVILNQINIDDDPTKSSIHWMFDPEDVVRFNSAGALPDLIKLADYNNRNTNYYNPDYTNDYISIVPSFKKADPAVQLNNKAVVYYKKTTDFEISYLKSKTLTVTVGGYDYEVLLDPNVLIKDNLLSYEQIEQFESFEINVEESSSDTIQLPVYNLEPGNYIYFIKITDSTGKSNFASFYYEKQMSTNAITKDSFTISSNTITGQVIGDYIYRRFGAKYINDGKWETAGNSEVYYNHCSKPNINGERHCTNEYVNSVSLNNTQYDSKTDWMKIYCHESDYGAGANLLGRDSSRYYTDHRIFPVKFFYHEPIYIYPNPDGTGSSAVPPFNSSNVGIKNIIEGKALSILCTQTSLAQTFYSPVNYGEDAEKWECYTKSDWALNPVAIPAGGGNYEIPVKEIPNENYYCVIVRFSDGSTLMTTPKKNGN